MFVKSASARPSAISLASAVVASREQVSCDIAGESVLLSLRTGVYYGLNAVAARVWALIEQPRTVASVCDALLEEFEGVTREQCVAEVLALLEQLAGWELIEVVDTQPT
jgi:hypothetical protein